MGIQKGTIRRLDVSALDGVERLTEADPPSAFRIWKSGENVTDHGPTRFTERSALLLMAEQLKRGNRYSMDVNHLSLNHDAPIQNQRAVGFFSIDVREGELWAVDCEWTDLVRAGLVSNPPEWKYFSPAYEIDKETSEVVSLLNCALTNNPATHHVTALATRAEKKAVRMNYEDVCAALESGDEDKKAAAMEAIRALFEAQDETEEVKDEEVDSEAKADAELPEEEETKKDAEEPMAEEKKDSRHVVASQDAALRSALARISKLEAAAESGERARLIASRDVSGTLAKSLASLPLATVRNLCAGLPPKPRKDLAAASFVSATRGATQASGTASRLPPAEASALAARMGVGKREPVRVVNEGTKQVFAAMSAADAALLLKGVKS